REPLGAELRDRVRAPERAASVADAARREEHRRVRGLAQQRQQTARKNEWRGEVHEQHALPDTDVVVLDRAQVPEHARVVEQTVETPVALLDLLGQRLILRALRALEVELGDRGLGTDRRELPVELLQLLR